MRHSPFSNLPSFYDVTFIVLALTPPPLLYANASIYQVTPVIIPNAIPSLNGDISSYGQHRSLYSPYLTSDGVALNAFFPPDASFPFGFVVPYLWQNGATTPFPADTRALVLDATTSGDVVGWTGELIVPYPVLWRNGQTILLPVPELYFGTANAVNNAGHVAGTLRTFTPSSNAVLWTGGDPIILAPDATPLAINDHDQVLLVTDSGSKLWSNGTLTPLLDSKDLPLFASALNNLGHAAGSGWLSTPDQPIQTAFLYDHGAITFLPPLPDTLYTSIFSLNDADQVLGSSSLLAGAPVPTLWQDGIPYDINALLAPNSNATLLYAFDIDATGRIAAYGTYLGQPTYLLLTPIPEPASLALLLPCTLALARRRRPPSPC